jgi:TonB family protein
VAATIRRRMPGLEACYEKALRSNASLKGKMTYTITINPSGRVTDVTIEEDTVGDSSVRSCTEAKIKGWRFVSEGAEESSEVTFSVAFTG